MSEAAPGAGRSTRWRSLRGPRLWIVIGAGAILALVVGGALVLKAILTPEKLRAMVVPRMEAALGREVALRSVSLRVFPRLAVRVEEFSVAGGPAFPDQPPLALEALELRARLLPLLRRRLEIEELRLIRPAIRYSVGPDGTSNFSGLGPAASDTAAAPREAARPGPGAASAGLLAVSDLTLVDGSIVYTDARNGRTVWIDEVDARVAAGRLADAAGVLESTGHVGLTGIRLLASREAEDTAAIPYMALDYALRADLPGDSVTLETVRLGLGAVVLSGSGAIRRATTDPRFELDLASDGDVELGRMVASLPKDITPPPAEIAGRARLSARVRAGPRPGPDRPLPLSVRGRIELEDVAASRDGADRWLTDGVGSIEFTTDTLTVSRFEARFLGRPLSLSATVSDLADPRVRAELDGAADLGALSRIGIAGPPAEGIVAVDLRVSGPVRRPAALEVRGPVRLSDVVYRSASLAVPVRIRSGTLQIAGDRVTVERLPVVLGRSDLTLSLTARGISGLLTTMTKTVAGPPRSSPSVEFRVTSDRVDWGEILPDTTRTGYSSLVAARLAGREVGGRKPEVVARERYRLPPLPPVEATGRVEIAELVNPPTRATDVSFDMTVRRGVLEVSNLRGVVYGGALTGTMSLDASQGRPPFPLRYDFRLRGGRASEVVDRWTRLGSVVGGALDFTIAGRTRIDETLLPEPGATDASGRSTFRDGGFRDFEPVRRLANTLRVDPASFSSFRELGGAYEISEDAVRLDGWQFAGEDLSGRVTGSAGLAGALDLRLELRVPAATIRESGLLQRAGLGDLLSTLTRGREHVDLRVGVGGTVSNPSIEVDNESLRDELGKAGRDLLKGLFDR